MKDAGRGRLAQATNTHKENTRGGWDRGRGRGLAVMRAV